MSHMSRQAEIDRNWHDLMSMCKREQEYKAEHRHPKLLRFITQQIDKLAADMGFSEQQIKSREFRAAKDGERISKIFID
jgi:hypothetical protein